MPLQQTLYTPGALNTANSTSPSGNVDLRSGLPNYGGGLNPGVYFDLTESEAKALSSPALSPLFAGRYRWVYIDQLATPANIFQGAVAYWPAGVGVQQAILLTPGQYQTPGVYQVFGTGGGGTGATLQVVVSINGTVQQTPTVTSVGSGYTGVPTFTLTGAGGTAATFAVQLALRVNTVTTADKALAGSLIRGVFLNVNPAGTYAFIQEDGVATVLGNATLGTGTAPGSFVNGATGGTVTTTASTGSPLGNTFGLAWDAPVANGLFRAILDLPVIAG